MGLRLREKSMHDDSNAAGLLHDFAAAVSRAMSRAHCTSSLAMSALRAYWRRAYIRRVWRPERSRRLTVAVERGAILAGRKGPPRGYEMDFGDFTRSRRWRLSCPPATESRLPRLHGSLLIIFELPASVKENLSSFSRQRRSG
jgi:hypothetical protein